MTYFLLLIVRSFQSCTFRNILEDTIVKHMFSFRYKFFEKNTVTEHNLL